MKAYQVINLTKGRVRIKSPVRMIQDIRLQAGERHLFASPDEYATFSASLARLSHAKVVKIEEIKQQKPSGGVQVPPQGKTVDAQTTTVDDDKGTDDKGEDDKGTETDNAEVVEKINKMKDHLRELQVKYKAETDNEVKKAMAEDVKAIKEEIKSLNSSK